MTNTTHPITCPGCDAEITINANDVVGMTYCKECAYAIPGKPNNGKTYQLTGRYPNFEWVEV